ncbi:MAG: cyclodeaminase/cyclohydrolase family protein [Elusimicrobia bacterium]|jgi:formiminotetrahydrofolate cyclodeaminase|nr:cyclodeaminase/cyclohydrolase family protein [Elusimicrobiota bacterium]
MSDILDGSLKSYIDKVASSAGTPGGGNVIATVNSLAASLMLMSLRIAILKKESDSAEALKFEQKLLDIKEKSLELAEEDSREFKKVMKYWSEGGKYLEKSLKSSAAVSLKIAQKSVLLIELINSQDLSLYKNIITDVAISFYFAEATFRGGIANTIINAKLLKSKDNKSEILKMQTDIEKRYTDLAENLKDKLEIIIKR